MTHSRRALTGVLLALALSGCGSSASGEQAAPAAATPDEPTPPSTPPSTPSSTPADGSAEPAPYVPGDPQNDVRPATARERADWPACEEVWRPDGRIPGRYRGCVDGERAVVADRIACSFGGSMTTYGDRYYGVVGNVVNDAGRSLARSRAYLHDYRLCTG